MGRLEEAIVMRIPVGTTERAEALASIVSIDPKFSAIGKITKSMILRFAMLEGLELLEKRYKSKRKKKSVR